jgi:hypothetical protein
MMTLEDSIRHYLEKMHINELRTYAEVIGLEIDDNTDRLFIINEILEMTECLDYISGPYTGKKKRKSITTLLEDSEDLPELPEAALIPSSYHNSFIDIVVRDPFWIFAWWEIKEAEVVMLNAMQGFKGFCVCVQELNDDNSGAEDLFLMDVAENETKRYIHFQCGGCPVRLVLYAVFEGSRQSIAVSRAVRMPPLLEHVCPVSEAGTGKEAVDVTHELHIISGYNDFVLLRNADMSLNNADKIFEAAIGGRGI